MNSGQISLGLDLTYASSIITTQKPIEREFDLLFEAMYDDYIGGQPLATPRTAPATSVPQNVDELETQPQHVQQQDNQALLQPEIVVDKVANAVFDGYVFENPFASPSTSAAESSSLQNVDPSNMHTYQGILGIHSITIISFIPKWDVKLLPAMVRLKESFHFKTQQSRNQTQFLSTTDRSICNLLDTTMTTLADKSLLSGGDNKPPMLEKHLYDSWKSRMELYMLNRNTVPFCFSMRNILTHIPAEAIQAIVTSKSINIIPQGLPTKSNALVSPTSSGAVGKDSQMQVILQLENSKQST
ncbi:hypothetical protein Tco_0010928 [Tanacetum coccineum]